MTAFSTFCHHLFLPSALSFSPSTFFLFVSSSVTPLSAFPSLFPFFFFTFQSLALSASALKMYLQSSFTVCELFFPYINLPDYHISVQTVQSHTETSIHQSLSQANSLEMQSSMCAACKIQQLLTNQIKSLMSPCIMYTIMSVWRPYTFISIHWRVLISCVQAELVVCG